MTPEEAWDIIRDNIHGDCGCPDFAWNSENLEEAIEVFHRLYAPHLTAKAL